MCTAGRRLERVLGRADRQGSRPNDEAVHKAVDAGSREFGETARHDGARPCTALGLGGPGEPRHDRFDPLPHDLVVVDETSMVSLPLMARLLDAVRPRRRWCWSATRTSSPASRPGAVLGEIVGPESSRPYAGTARGDRAARPDTGSVPILRSRLADAIRRGDDDRGVELLGKLAFW